MADDLLADYRRELTDVKRERDDLKKALDKREEDNKGYRDRIKTLEQEAEGLKGRIPAEGSITLTKADAERFEAYKALGKLDEVKAKVEGYGDLEAKDQRREREDQIKGFGFKPSIFELIAEGKPFRAEGEGDDRSVYLTVDDKEVELTEYASERGLDDLLSVMGASVKEPTPTVRTPTGAGNKKPRAFQAVDPDAAHEEKKRDSQYSI